MRDITLFHFWRSSASWRVRWALAIKGFQFKSVMVDLVAGEQREEAHRARNPIGHVPALHIDDLWISESVAILEYLEETRKEPALYPTDPRVRVRVRQIVELVNSGIQPLQNLEVLRRHAAEKDAQTAWARFFNERGLQALERLLEKSSTGTFAVGATLTAADLFVVPQVYSARRFGVDLSAYPCVLGAERAALETPHAQAALPENQPGAPI